MRTSPIKNGHQETLPFSLAIREVQMVLWIRIQVFLLLGLRLSCSVSRNRAFLWGHHRILLLMSSLTKNAVIVLVMGFLFYTYRERIRQALTAAAEVMQEYNDQYDHDLEEEEENSETDKKED
jgi:hypothetical protein